MDIRLSDRILKELVNLCKTIYLEVPNEYVYAST